jgi:6,7-dimethyl-8-ribityllumazine synthase
MAKGCIRVRSDSVTFFFQEEAMDQPVQATAAQTVDEAAPMKIAIVSSCWHKPIVGNAVQAVKGHLTQVGIRASDLDFFEVPGAFELPLHAKALAQTRRYTAIIVCGFVVNGGIYEHSYVASAVIHGLMQVQLESGIPIFSAVLTPLNFHGHEDHASFFANHVVSKGVEVARACVDTLESLKNVARKCA